MNSIDYDFLSNILYRDLECLLNMNNNKLYSFANEGNEGKRNFLFDAIDVNPVLHAIVFLANAGEENTH